MRRDGLHSMVGYNAASRKFIDYQRSSMKTDLNALMQAYAVDGLLVVGSGDHNPAMMYLTGGGHFNGILIQKRGAQPLLFCNAMEREEAAKTGLPTKLIDAYKPIELLKLAGGDALKATVMRYEKMLADCNLTSGRVLIYGRAELGAIFSVLNGVQAALPGLAFVGEAGNTLLMEAQLTKDASEADRIRKMGQVTTAVVGQVADFLTSHGVHDGALVKSDGQPLTLGEVKSRINLWLAERGAENPQGTIFAIGRDAGIPHNSGNPSDLMRLGQTIVFDIYPCEAGGGYYHDFTRTWCLGYAPDEALQLYEQVLSVYNQITAELKAKTLYKAYQLRACELFEAMGHPTVKTDPQTQEGYVHSLGHGVGLNIHERPWSGATAGEADLLAPGAVFTIEPGLYYPSRGMGVRLENTLWVNPQGGFEIMADYPMDLVLPVSGIG
jgi:Xaa-Pro aminopeptidase